MNQIVLLMLLVITSSFSGSLTTSRFDGIYLCDNKLKLEELKIAGDTFFLAHLSHVDGKYTRQGKVSISGDTIQLIEEKNTLTDSNDLMEFHSQFLLKDNHLFVLFKDQKNKKYIKNSSFNFSKEESEYLLKQDWIKE